MSIHHVVICGMPGSTTFFNNIVQTIGFSIKIELLNKQCVLIFSIKFETFPIVRRNEGDVIINEHVSSSKVPVILVRFS
jgi:hypothetical protein